MAVGPVFDPRRAQPPDTGKLINGETPFKPNATPNDAVTLVPVAPVDQVSPAPDSRTPRHHEVRSGCGERNHQRQNATTGENRKSRTRRCRLSTRRSCSTYHSPPLHLTRTNQPFAESATTRETGFIAGAEPEDNPNATPAETFGPLPPEVEAGNSVPLAFTPR